MVGLVVKDQMVLIQYLVIQSSRLVEVVVVVAVGVKVITVVQVAVQLSIGITGVGLHKAHPV